MPMPIETVDDIMVEATDLAHLLETVHMVVHEMDRDKMGQGNIRELDRIHALIRIAQDKAERLSDEVGANHLKIRGAK
jgi:hypothetical protein